MLLEHSKFGQLAKDFCEKNLPLQVMNSHAGFYIGTMGEFGPCSRESNEYFKTHEKAESALETGNWTQKESP